jgi:hypothetical protein
MKVRVEHGLHDRFSQSQREMNNKKKRKMADFRMGEQTQLIE